MNIDHFQMAWLGISDHIKDTYQQIFGSKAWYELLEEVRQNKGVGIDAYKSAVSKLAKECAK